MAHSHSHPTPALTRAPAPPSGSSRPSAHRFVPSDYFQVSPLSLDSSNGSLQSALEEDVPKSTTQAARSVFGHRYCRCILMLTVCLVSAALGAIIYKFLLSSHFSTDSTSNASAALFPPITPGAVSSSSTGLTGTNSFVSSSSQSATASPSPSSSLGLTSTGYFSSSFARSSSRISSVSSSSSSISSSSASTLSPSVPISLSFSQSKSSTASSSRSSSSLQPISISSTGSSSTAGSSMSSTSSAGSPYSITGKTFYVSNTDGSDSYSLTQAQSPSTPWKTIARVNSIWSSISAGDGILLKRGDVFTGPMTVQTSGSRTRPIVIGAYGTGSDPVITGRSVLSNWTNVGGGIYEADCPACQSTVGLVFINGKNYPMGRWPNSNSPNGGWRSISSTTGVTSITDNSLPSSPNWTGAELVIRPNPWITDRCLITLHSGANINYNTVSGDTPSTDSGYFIQNHRFTLDSFGEWWFDPNTKRMAMFFGSSGPGTNFVEVSVVPNLLTIQNQGFIHVYDIEFHISQSDMIIIDHSQYVLLSRLQLIGAGNIAISIANSNYLVVQYCIGRGIHNAFLNSWGGVNYATIEYNEVQDIGIYSGMGESPLLYQGISLSGSFHSQILRNILYQIGYNGISFFFSGNLTIRENRIESYCMVKDDGSGIYTWNSPSSPVEYPISVISFNFIFNGTGNPFGRYNPDFLMAHGIYIDDNGSNLIIHSNTIAYSKGAGLFLHHAHKINITNNTVFNNGDDGIPNDSVGQLFLSAEGGVYRLRNIRVFGNLFVSGDTTQWALKVESRFADFNQFGVFDSNIYGRPANENNQMGRVYDSSWPTAQVISLAEWRAMVNGDANSVVSPVTVNSKSNIRFEPNPTANIRQISFPAPCRSMKGTLYPANSVISILPFSTVILLF